MHGTFWMNEWARKLYLGELFRKDVPAYSIPARATDYRNIPSAVIFDGSLEPFIDETVQYVENLRKARVHVDSDLYNRCTMVLIKLIPEQMQAK